MALVAPVHQLVRTPVKRIAEISLFLTSAFASATTAAGAAERRAEQGRLAGHAEPRGRNPRRERRERGARTPRGGRGAPPNL